MTLDVVCQAFGCTPDKAAELLSSQRWRRVTIGCLEARTAERLVDDFRASGKNPDSADTNIGKWTAHDAAFFRELMIAAGHEQPAFDELS